jgi:mRNA-degrading endonuclease RelE of RelBE toxin-antitoxin system
MSYNIELTHNFEREFKKLYKKYPSLKNEITELASQLRKNPKTGTSIGKDCYKIRLAIRSKGKGKSGGARIITHIHIAGKKIYLLSIYDKSEQDSITDKQLNALLAFLS